MERKLVIVDCDAGIDDALALILLAGAHKLNKIQLLAVTCVNGNTNVENVVNNVFRTLQTCGLADIPVYKGAYSPLLSTESARIAATELFHGPDGFGNMFIDKPDTSKLQKEHAVHALYRMVCENPGEVSITCIGPLTNIALAIKLYPDFISKVKEFYVMGGNYTAQGNITAQAEFNFYSDPESVHIFLANNIKPHVLLPWETCMKYAVDPKWKNHVFGKIDTPEVRLMDTLHEFYLNNNKGYAIHKPCDAILAAIVLRPDMATKLIEHHADIELTGCRTRGQVVIDHLESNKPNTSTVIEYDSEIFKELLILALDPENYEGDVL
ncbi:pyrimidine-specific ribonucleoside hydrolase RihA-like [Diprion similis]|uniref:pyrimidine-specific ribonucleoside hydrolase RihA-like n=1 Tax=Diprion similis TaxID=362088 RepID=UPI001EF8A71D|nr:pyrimidine-specific ribonucleoside hydrolase RihA-like [Diprion similis]